MLLLFAIQRSYDSPIVAVKFEKLNLVNLHLNFNV